MIATSDNALRSTIDRVLRHDRDALEELLLMRYEWLREVAERSIPANVRSRVSVDEVLQESFVRFLRGFPMFTPSAGEAGLFGWLKTIVQNVAKDALRKLAASREALMTDQGGNVVSSDSESQRVAVAVANDPRASVVARDREMQQAFRMVLASLDSKYQQVLELLYFDGLTVEQAAAKMGITPAAVRGLRQRAREKIRDAMNRLSHFV